MSNWRPAACMRPHHFLNAALSYLLNRQKLTNFGMKRLLNRKKVDNISKLRPADSFSVFECHCVVRFKFDMPAIDPSKKI